MTTDGDAGTKGAVGFSYNGHTLGMETKRASTREKLYHIPNKIFAKDNFVFAC